MKKQISNIKRNLVLHIQKSYIEGVYTDNAQNRKLGRVGMTYGHGLNIEGFEDEEDKEEEYTINPKLILKRIKSKVSERGLKLVKDLFQSNSFVEGDIAEYNGKIYLNSVIEVNPQRDKDIINLGERKEEEKSISKSSYYEFLDKTYGKSVLEKELLTSYEEQKSWGTSKHYSLLNKLVLEYGGRKSVLEEAKKDIYWENRNIYSSYSEVSDEKAEKYIREKGRKWQKENLKYYSKNKKLIQLLQNYGVDFDGKNLGDMDKDDNKLFKFIINCPRKEFYDAIKQGITEGSYDAVSLIRARFSFKYNKTLAGNGWFKINDKDGKILLTKRDNIIGLAQQLEYAVDDVLGEDKDLFIKNQNIEYIYYDEKTNWGGASYSKSEKVITITDEYFQSLKNSRKNNKYASTLSREKFMVEGFIHEIGHSTDVTADIYKSEAYKDFARHLGYDKNYLYTIYTNAIKGDDSIYFVNADSYLNIEKDKKQELLNIFEDAFLDTQEKLMVQEIWNNSQLAKVFISDYSSKSAAEGYAEYFSFYMGNKKVINKAIENYDKNPVEFLKTANIGDWYKYSVYNKKWKEWVDGYDFDQHSKKEREKYYQLVVKHNIEMLKDIQKIVKILKKKYK